MKTIPLGSYTTNCECVYVCLFSKHSCFRTYPCCLCSVRYTYRRYCFAIKLSSSNLFVASVFFLLESKINCFCRFSCSMFNFIVAILQYNICSSSKHHPFSVSVLCSMWFYFSQISYYISILKPYPYPIHSRTFLLEHNCVPHQITNNVEWIGNICPPEWKEFYIRWEIVWKSKRTKRMFEKLFQ